MQSLEETEEQLLPSIATGRIMLIYNLVWMNVFYWLALHPGFPNWKNLALIALVVYLLLGLRQKLRFYPTHVIVKRLGQNPVKIDYTNIDSIERKKAHASTIKLTQKVGPPIKIPAPMELQKTLRSIYTQFQAHGVDVHSISDFKLKDI